MQIISTLLDKAFLQLKSFVVKATLSRKTVVFNPDTLSNDETVSNKICDAIITKRSESKDKHILRVLVKTKDVTNLGEFNYLIFTDGTPWSIAKPITSNGYISYIEVHK
jgi:hypothetical protein